MKNFTRYIRLLALPLALLLGGSLCALAPQTAHAQSPRLIYDLMAPPAGSGQTALVFNDPTGNVAKIRAARDYVFDDGAGNTTKSKVIYLPGHPAVFQTNAPTLMDVPGVKIRGDGLALSRLKQDNGPLIWGMMRKPLKPGTAVVQDLSLLANRAYDLNGLLDSSIAGNNTAGVNFGHYLNLDSFLAFPQTELSLGPQPGGWAGIRQCTWDWLFYFPAPLTQQVDCGSLSEDGQSAPWQHAIDPSSFISVFYDSNLVRHSIQAFGTMTGLVRISYQLDFDAGTVQCYVSRTQVARNIAGGSFAGKTLLAQRYGHYQIGDQAGFFGGTAEPAAAFPGVVIGYRFSNGLLYKDNGVGQPQARLDNTALTDGSQFFGEGGATKFVLRLLTATSKTDAVVERVFPTRPNNQWGLWAQTGHGYVGNVVSGCTVEDISLAGGLANYGVAALGIGNLYFHAKNAEFNGQNGSGGYVQPRAMTNYVSVFDHCSFMGGTSDVALGLNYGIAVVRDCTFNAFGRYAVRTLTTDLAIEGRNLFGNGNCEAYVAMLTFGDPVQVDISGARLDIEGGIYPSVAAFLIEASTSAPTNVRISTPVAGTLGPNVPFVKLMRRRGDSGVLSNGRSSVHLESPYWGREAGQPILSIDKTGWDAQVVTNNPGAAPQITTLQAGPGQASVIALPASAGGGGGRPGTRRKAKRISDRLRRSRRKAA